MISKDKKIVAITIDRKKLKDLKKMAIDKETTLSELLVDSACQVGNLVQTYPYNHKK